MKRLIIAFLATLICMMFTGCNYQAIDTTYNYNYAYISLPNGECVEGKVDSWRDYEDGDQIQIKIEGRVYLTDTTRAVLVKE